MLKNIYRLFVECHVWWLHMRLHEISKQIAPHVPCTFYSFCCLKSARLESMLNMQKRDSVFADCTLFCGTQARDISYMESNQSGVTSMPTWRAWICSDLYCTEAGRWSIIHSGHLSHESAQALWLLKCCDVNGVPNWSTYLGFGIDALCDWSNILELYRVQCATILQKLMICLSANWCSSFRACYSCKTVQKNLGEKPFYSVFAYFAFTR